MSVRRGDVVLVDYPYSDRTGSKVRPAVVMQADALNPKITDTIIAAISSTSRGTATQFSIGISTPDGKRTGLRSNCCVQCENILTIDQKFILGSIGKLSASLVKQLDTCLKAALSLPWRPTQRRTPCFLHHRLTGHSPHRGPIGRQIVLP